MSKPKWTPGPWEISPADPSVVRAQGPGQGMTIVKGVHVYANAHLIAAAPGLYEALEAALTVIEMLFPGIKHISVRDYALLNEAPIAARAALAKAKGEAPDGEC